MKSKLLLYLFLGFSVLAMAVGFSPLEVGAISPNSIYVEAVPKSPDPNENTTITLSSYLADLDSSTITWFTDGKNVLSGIGKKSFVLNAPSAGEEINVVAKIVLPDGTIEKSILIRSSTSMTLLWQAESSYVPPFYKGRTLPSPGSQIKIVAMPEIKSGTQAVGSKNFVYSWKKDFTNNPDGSGYGKNYFIYTGDYLDDSNTIDVSASTTDGKYSLVAGIEVPTFSPKIVFYKEDLALGTLWEKSIESGYKITGKEIIRAVPYFVSLKDIYSPLLLWNWYLNDATVGIVDADKSLLPLAAKEGVSGSAKVRLEINNWDKLFENPRKEIRIDF